MPVNQLQDIIYFAEQGGHVIWLLLVVCGVLWTLIVERLWFFLWPFNVRSSELVSYWAQRLDKQSWKAHRIREQLIAQVSLELNAFLPWIKTLVMVCPLLGLLGTVTGMVNVFEVIAANGSSDAQAMAQGVYRATIPTMAGLVVAISGLYFSVHLQRWAQRKVAQFGDQLTISSQGADHGRA